MSQLFSVDRLLAQLRATDLAEFHVKTVDYVETVGDCTVKVRIGKSAYAVKSHRSQALQVSSHWESEFAFAKAGFAPAPLNVATTDFFLILPWCEPECPSDVPVVAGLLSKIHQSEISLSTVRTPESIFSKLSQHRILEGKRWKELLGKPVPTSPIHGDAHLGNFLNLASGPVSLDQEFASMGDPAWDFAYLFATHSVPVQSQKEIRSRHPHFDWERCLMWQPLCCLLWQIWEEEKGRVGDVWERKYRRSLEWWDQYHR